MSTKLEDDNKNHTWNNTNIQISKILSSHTIKYFGSL